MRQTPAVQSLLRRLERGSFCACAGVSAPAQAFLAAFLHQTRPTPVVVLVDSLKAQENVLQDLETWLTFRSMMAAPALASAPSAAKSSPPLRPLFYPSWEVLPHESKLPHADVISDRLASLVALLDAEQEHMDGVIAAEGEGPLLVVSITALLQPTLSPPVLRDRTIHLRRGDQIPPLELMEKLEASAYEPEAKVDAKGQTSLRGGILDVFPLTSPWPVRLEFFGDELESLRYFDPLTQISKESLAQIVIPPAGELGLLKALIAQQPDPSHRAPHPFAASLLDFLPSSTLFIVCEPANVDQQAEDYSASIPAHDPLLLSWDQLQAVIRQRGMTRVDLEETWLSSPPGSDPDLKATTTATAAPDPNRQVALPLLSLEAFRPIGEHAQDLQVMETQRREFFAQLHRWLRQDFSVHIFCNNEGERQRFVEVWAEYGLGRIPLTAPPRPPGGLGPSPIAAPSGAPTPRLHLGALSRGFVSEDARFVVVTDAEIFGRYKVQRPRRLKSPHAASSRSLLEIDFSDLEEGDYVVHLEHGIGRYLGLQFRPLGGGIKPLEKAKQPEGMQECLVIEYAPSQTEQPAPKLYVPISEAHLVSKYVGAGKAQPPLNTLGGPRWTAAKEQAQIAVRDLAAELLSIQAARESQPGYAFAPDTPWQREFESAFLFEETPDQCQAILATKTDMEKGKPMDRLICGDVGYGKTEVAIRAAFKAVMSGKQVAVLVPTTVLAQQHFNTFRERMLDYPTQIELLSRFRTRREQTRVLEKLASGAVDVVIGTHRLLQDDIVFKDLGLVVIDEEQRFGVLHKEKFKMLRRLVDVLTLSATPIPRTLHLALTGARDMSMIETPPADRLPVQTFVTPYDERVIRDAIQREINRGGQVFFLHNRVLDIDAVALRLKALVPKARIVVGHGQMDADQLEEVMTTFVNGNADVLLSTTIIESGLDIPNANTIIIERADRFGLSDLYQLRGRVGRYKHQAFAYLLLPRHAGLLSDARKRISAIKQYSSLGSGFRIAMRDLEIRGAGNLLGPQQSGHIAAVGFDLYCQLLKQSVSALKGEKPRPRVSVQVRFDFLPLQPGANPGQSGFEAGADSHDDGSPAAPQPRSSPVAGAYIPANYIPDSRQRIEAYRKLAEVQDDNGLEQLRSELRDRYGAPPESLEFLLQVAALKLIASRCGIRSMESREDKLILSHGEDDFIMVGGKFPRLGARTPKARLKEIRRLLQALPPGRS